MFSATLKHTIKNILPDKARDMNIVSDLAIVAQKYSKIFTQEEKKFQ